MGAVEQTVRDLSRLAALWRRAHEVRPIPTISSVTSAAAIASLETMGRPAVGNCTATNLVRRRGRWPGPKVPMRRPKAPEGEFEGGRSADGSVRTSMTAPIECCYDQRAK